LTYIRLLKVTENRVMTGFADTIDDVLPFVGNPEPEPPKAREWYATQSQQAGLVRLNALADLFSRVGDSRPGSFQPLLRALIIGGTGVGKSTLAREFARQRDWAYTSVDCGSWLIQGSYSKPPTLRLLRDHVRSSSRSCIYLDEMCKAFPVGQDARSGWYLSVFSEVIALVDGDERLRVHDWTSHDIQKYRAFFRMRPTPPIRAKFAKLCLRKFITASARTLSWKARLARITPAVSSAFTRI
jgi:hypothetical protein